MLYFTGQKEITAIKRQLYVGNISSFTTVGTSTCYLRPLSEIESSNNGSQYGILYNAIFESDVDVRENDKIIIDSIEYLIKGVSNHDRGAFTQYKKALVVKPQL